MSPLTLVVLNYPYQDFRGNLPEENLHGKTGNRTWDTMINIQNLPLDNEADKFISSIYNDIKSSITNLVESL